MISRFILTWILRIFFSVCAISLSCSAWADCTLRNGTSTVLQQINIPALRLNYTNPADTILWESPVITASTMADIYCYTDQVVESGYQSAKTPVSDISTSYVYETNNPGIGIKILAGQDMSNLIPMAWPHGTEQAKASYAYKQQNNFKVQLIATGSRITTGVLNLTNYSVERVFGSARQYLMSFNPTSVFVQSVGCDIETKDITVPLTGSQGIAITSLPRSGNTTSPVSFDIVLNCEQGTNVNIKFDGTTTDGQKKTLALDNPNQSSSARGVGVQVMYNYQPVTFGKEVYLLSNADSTTITLPFQAWLIRLSDAIEAGDVNATATFDMIYR